MPTELDYLKHPKGALGAVLASRILASPKSIRDIADEMDTNPTGIKGWVGKGVVPRPHNQEKIAAWLGISPLEVARLAAGYAGNAPPDGEALGVIHTSPEKADVGRRILAYPAWVLERLAAALEAVKEEGAAEYRQATPEADAEPDPGPTG